VLTEARERANDRILDLLLPERPTHSTPPPGADPDLTTETEQQYERARERFARLLQEGKLEDRTVEITLEERSMPSVEIFSNAGVEQMGFDFQNLFERMMPTRHITKTMSVREARDAITQQEAEKLVDREKVRSTAMERVQQSGIIFLDEIDKITAVGQKGAGPDVSREGVQRDLLPIVEGSTVVTRHGMVRTDHILFIAAGAFHASKPSDLIPELQGRFPIRVELDSLTEKDFVRILTEPENSLTKQYAALLDTEGIALDFTSDAVQAIAAIAALINQRTQNIGARRLHTVMEKLLEDISFNAPDLRGREVTMDGQTVKDTLKALVADEDLSRYIL
jgi:ATP-dependent HslUV protease ATP-binding subunit HslU